MNERIIGRGAELASEPLVSIVTPVYNGETYLEECIQSVLAQEYGHWEYVIVNNRSTDRTLEIATRYAGQDRRIRISDNPEFLPLVRNWNHALRQISPESKYCKVIHADDTLLPGCLRSMVDLAERHPQVGLVASRYIRGEVPWPRDLPFAEGVVDGHDAVRFYFTSGINYIGTPSSVLIRSDIVRQNEVFHNEANLHSSDLEAWVTLLEHYPLGFVDAVLMRARHHAQSLTSKLKRFNLNRLSRMYLLIRYGARFLPADEYRRRVVREVRIYHRILLGGLLSGDFELVRYHWRELRRLNVGAWRAYAAAMSQGWREKAHPGSRSI